MRQFFHELMRQMRQSIVEGGCGNRERVYCNMGVVTLYCACSHNHKTNKQKNTRQIFGNTYSLSVSRPTNLPIPMFF